MMIHTLLSVLSTVSLSDCFMVQKTYKHSSTRSKRTPD